MKHLGDIKNMTAENTPCVDLVTFGSPCQDLSVAGMRAGLAGERSGLFMDAVRVIKDMFWNSMGQFPKFAVWENVPGAFSSNKGEDFRAVLEELARVKEPGVTIPRPENGKWAKAGVICGDGWSVAWRTFDAQFWGVPQRRRRIAVVLDLGGQRAAEILFERTGVPGDPDQSIPSWKGIARDPARCAAGYDRVVGDPRAYTLKIRSGCEGGGKGPLVQTEKSATLSTLQEQTLFCLQGNVADRTENSGPEGAGYRSDDKCFTLNTRDRHIVCLQGNMIDRDVPQNGSGIAESETMFTLNATDRHGVCCAAGGLSAMPTVLCRAHGQARAETLVDCSPTLSCNHEQPIVAFSKETYNTGENATCSLGIESGDVAPTMRADTHPSGVAYRGHLRWIVRRLTPTECERLQGFPDGWTDIGEWVDSRGRSRKTADGPRYKAMGNSIALPQWRWLTCKMARYLPEHATLGSLFDGVGGFPLVWETYHGEGTAVWASEIEDFPIAVTKKHFGGD